MKYHEGQLCQILPSKKQNSKSSNYTYRHSPKRRRRKIILKISRVTYIHKKEYRGTISHLGCTWGLQHRRANNPAHMWNAPPSRKWWCHSGAWKNLCALAQEYRSPRTCRMEESRTTGHPGCRLRSAEYTVNLNFSFRRHKVKVKIRLVTHYDNVNNMDHERLIAQFKWGCSKQMILNILLQ